MQRCCNLWYHFCMDLRSIRPKHKKRANELEKQLRETVHRYRLLFEATNDVLFDVDLKTKTVMWNDVLYKHCGYRRTKRVNTLDWWLSRVHPDDAMLFEIEITKWFENRQTTWESDYRFRMADGNYIFMHSRSIIQRAHDGTPERVIGSLQDVTKQIQLINAKDEFISLVSHQLRTPLAAIRMYSEMLTGGTFGTIKQKQHGPINQITESSIRLIKLVDDILSISKVELGNFITAPLPTNINDLLAKHIKEVTPLAKEKNVTLQFAPDVRIKDVSIDVTIFDQVIHNLLTNAIRYTEQDKGVIDVAFTINKNKYLLAVKDNGIGIPEEEKKFVFDRFFRANNAIKSGEVGTGIGLYLIKMMLDASNCKIWFESNESQGTTFYVQIPSQGMGIK